MRSALSRLTAMVDGLSQMAHDDTPGVIEMDKGTAQGLPAWESDEHGITVTAPDSVLRYDITMTGRRFQNSGRCASSGKSHQYIWRMRGAEVSRGLTTGGRVSLIVMLNR